MFLVSPPCGAACDMDFSESYKCTVRSGVQPAYSPDGRYLANAVEYRLIIRDADSLRIIQLYSCLDRIDTLQFSPNSLYVLCGLNSRGIVQLWSVDQSDWTCKIDEGPVSASMLRKQPLHTVVFVLLYRILYYRNIVVVVKYLLLFIIVSACILELLPVSPALLCCPNYSLQPNKRLHFFRTAESHLFKIGTF